MYGLSEAGATRSGLEGTSLPNPGTWVPDISQTYEDANVTFVSPNPMTQLPPEPPTTVPGEVVNGGLCPAEGEVGYTQPKQVRLTCTATSWDR